MGWHRPIPRAALRLPWAVECVRWDVTWRVGLWRWDVTHASVVAGVRPVSQILKALSIAEQTDGYTAYCSANF